METRRRKAENEKYRKKCDEFTEFIFNEYGNTFIPRSDIRFHSNGIEAAYVVTLCTGDEIWPKGIYMHRCQWKAAYDSTKDVLEQIENVVKQLLKLSTQVRNGELPSVERE